MAPTHFSLGLLVFSVSSCTWETGPFSVIRVADFFFQLVIRLLGLFLLFGFPSCRTLFSCSEIDQPLWLLDF